MSMVRYLILRTLIFVGCLAATWLLGMRDREEQLLAVVIAAVASLVISAFVLKPFRQQASAALAERVDRRVERRREHTTGVDEDAEDAEIQRPQRRSDDTGSDSDFR
ncbi:hypothetical protein GCM10022415_19290 [Knoellia locipacati]|uniref:DUF4229 domain-containing protein n=1 Tax=Knoellia locipacati TaxID=882824 RepID=A0A512T104_9MICO|nr:DUF4229 domain-containing protein [Knoellia locipacati]GEQ13877.1 hypothetical protein KLO01_19240 [Knoellia locipacati]